MPKDNGVVEPDITINGQGLTFSQSMAVRVAIGNMRIWLADPAYRARLGARLADNYDARLIETERLMIESIRGQRQAKTGEGGSD